MEAIINAEIKADATELDAVLEALVDQHGDGVLQLAYFYLRDREMAEDIFQEVFTRVYTQLNRFRGESSHKTWIYRITVNLCRDRLRSWSVRRVLLMGEEFLGAAAPPVPEAESEVLAAADRTAVLNAVMELPVEFREVVLLYYYEEMETREVALALGLSEGTVRSRLHRARAKLKAMLARGGFGHGGLGHE